MSVVRIAEVAYPIPLHRSFDYEVPPELSGRALPGARVRAPFGPRSLVGVVLSVRDGEPSQPLKTLAAALDPEPLLTDELAGLARWLAERYCAPVGECVKLLAPANLRNARRALIQAGPAAVEAPKPAPPAAFELTGAQARAVERLSALLSGRAFRSALLFGVPASGKTEVYLRLIRQAVQGGGQALFLVPEIALTRPFFDEFKDSLGLPVALWHSQTGARSKREVWTGLKSGAIRVVVGARSACLLPFKDLRLAVLDEEQDESYKQDGQQPFYHARDVLLERCRRFGALAVLGSATPSLESWAEARRGGIELIRLDERVSRTTDAPPVRILARPPGDAALSDELLERLKECLARREQAVLVVNRRGFANFVICRKCGWVARCPDCGIAFIQHKAEDGLFPFELRCHHCARRGELPSACGRCRAPGPRSAGVGTQKVVAELKARLPGVRILRMDRDTVSKESSAEAGVYESFKEGRADVLVGTKLAAKGFHFPRVTLVGVVDADTMLNMPDFRSAERTVQLLVQAAGRAGRADRPGQVFLQTASPTHYAMQAVARGDYAGFAETEISLRGELSYPPASTLVRLVVQGRTEEAARKAAKVAAEIGPGLHPDDELLGPAPGVHAKLKGLYRYHLLLKIKEPSRLAPALEAVRALRLPSGTRLKANVDPYDFF